MRKILIISIFLSISSFFLYDLFAIPATPYPVKITQPDGTEITIKLHGDEFFNYKTTTDGYFIVSDKNGIFNYATFDADGSFKSSGLKASEINKRSSKEKSYLKNIPQNIDLRRINSKTIPSKISALNTGNAPQKTFPLTGSAKSIVILVNFADKSFVTANPQQSFYNLLNQDGYNTNGGTGSARDYFRDASTGAFVPQFDVVGPYTLPNIMSYYGENVSDNDKNPQQMIIDACTLADASGVDFTQYDTDKDGYVDNIFVYYAGNNEAEGAPANTIWPHRWTLANTSTKFDGKTIFDYACTSELKGSSGGSMCGIGTFCHEFGHVLGLVDYYATDNSSHHTLSYWNIMDSGAYLNSGRTPPTYSAYDRFFLNWLIPVELKTSQLATLNPLNTTNKAYIITQNGNHNLNGENPNPTEFFTLENRQQTGWDKYLPGHGMLITLINYNSNTWSFNTPNNNPATMGVDIIEADGMADNTSLGGDPFPGTKNVVSFNPKLRSGTNINKPITYIKESGGIITFRFMGGGNVPTIQTFNTINLFNTVQSTPSEPQKLKIYAKILEDSLRISFANNIHFEMRMQNENDNKWRKYIALSPVDSVIDSTYLLIRYNPTEPSFADTHNETLIMSSKNAETIKTLIYGKSSRPVYVVPPKANDALDVTLGSFIANWESVYDASGYYLTIYSLSDGESQRKQGFDNGLIPPYDWTISADAVTSSDNFSGDSIPAIQFKKTGDFIQTEEYLIPVTGLTFFAKSMSKINGYLLLEAWNGNKWTTVDNIPIVLTLSGIKSYTFTNENNYTRFRITFTRSSGYVVVDDVTAKFAKSIDYITINKWVKTTADTAYNLISNRYHYYKVKASDRTIDAANTIKYENITAFSNIVEVKTLEDKNVNSLRTLVQADGSVKVILPDTENNILVFNVLGQKITELTPTSNIINISGLARSKIYILQSGKRRSKIIL